LIGDPYLEELKEGINLELGFSFLGGKGLGSGSIVS
jgi:hypothetical protein